MLTIIGGIHAREALSGAPWYSRELRLIECPAGVAPLASENTHYRKQPHAHFPLAANRADIDDRERKKDQCEPSLGA